MPLKSGKSDKTVSANTTNWSAGAISIFDIWANLA